MKKLLLVSWFVIFNFSCSSVIKIPYYESVSYIDYSYFLDKGIFITESNSVSFDYTPKGSIYVEVRSGDIKDLAKQKSSKNKVHDGIYGESVFDNNYGKTWAVANIKDALNIMCEEVVHKDANGIINLKITPLSAATDVHPPKAEGYLITGMVIKR
ncbi:MAG: hypothetical protein E6767_20285 [Dysgonomonas sp.]|nr:hypothetical protein [Dysgonomonas sp.]